MGKLYFRVASDWEEVVKLRNEIEKLKQTLLSMDKNRTPAAVAELEVKLGTSRQRMDELVVSAAKAGAVMENDFKSKIYQSSQSVNDFTQKIINQKNAIGTLQMSLRKNKELYKTITLNGNDDKTLLNRIREQEKLLGIERDTLFRLTQEQANARLSVKKLRDEYSLYQKEGQNVVDSNNNMALSFKKTLAAIGGIAAIKQLGSEIIKVRGEFQSMQTAIETLVGKDMAGNLIPQIKELAKVSPLTLSDMVGAEKMMLGFNIKAEDTIRYLQALGDISMGNSQKFNSLTLAFSQMSAAGKLMGQDLNQMINAGFNPLQTISEKTGKSIATLKDEMSKGSVSAEMVQQAFIDATSAGGRFFGMSESVSKTINGQLSMMQDALDEVYNEIGTKGEGVIMSGIQATTSLIQNYETVGKVLIGLVATYGVARTATMVYYAMTRTYGIYDVATKELQFAATMKNVVATKALAVQQALLNKTMLSNPYILVATLVVGAAAAMWAFHDSTTAAEKAQKRFNDEKEQSIKKEQEHKQKLEELISAIQNEYTSSLDRVKAMDLIKANYPSIFQKYIDEKGHISDLISLWKEYNEEVSRGKVTENKKNYTDSKTLIDEYQKVITLWNKFGNDPNFHKNDLSADEKTLTNKYKNETLSTLKSKLDEEKKILVDYQKEIRSDELAQWQLDLKKNTDIQIKAELDEMKRIQQARKNNKHYSLNVGVGTLKGATTEGELQQRISVLEAEKQSRSGDKKAASEWLSSYKKAYEDADKAYNDFLKSKQVMSETDRDKELKRLKELRDTAKTTYESKGGSVSSDNKSVKKEETAAEKLRKEQEKLKSLQQKKSKDSIRQVKDLEFEAVQAKISTMQEGSEKNIAQMNLNHKKEIETLKRNREDYLQKKIEAERTIFKTDPSNKGKSFNSSTVSLSKGEEGMFKGLLESTISQQGNELATYYKEILSKYQGYAEKRLAAQKKFQEERDALTKAGASKESLAENDYQRDETYKSIDNEFAMREDSFKAWADSIADLSLEKLRELLIQASQELERAEFLNPNDPKLAGQRARVTSLKNAVSEKTAETNVSPNKRSQKEWQDLYKTLSKVENEFDEIGKAVGGTAGEILSAAGSIATSTLQMIDGIMLLADSSAWSMTATATAAQKAIKMVENASVILAIIGAALQIATKIANMFGADYSNYNKAKENYENYVEVLDTVISKQKELMETMTGKAAVEASQKALELIEKQANAARILGKERLNAGASAGSHSIGVRIRKGMSNEGWNEASKALGSDYNKYGIGEGRMTGLFDLSVEQLEKLQMEAPTFWAKLDGDVRGYLEQIIACNEKTEEMKDNLNEALTQISFDDVYSNFLDALSDMDASSEDFADNFEKYMQKAILNSMLIDNYKSRIDEWYKAFAKANDDNAGITQEEYKDLQEDWNDLVSDALSDRDKLKDIFGWTGDESTSQSSTKGAFETMSQDTGNELNGRFTALQIAGEEIKNQNILQTQSLNLLTMKTEDILRVNSEIKDIAGETRDLIANSYLELVQISENTGAIIKPIQQMQKDMAEVKKNTSKL